MTGAEEISAIGVPEAKDFLESETTEEKQKSGASFDHNEMKDQSLGKEHKVSKGFLSSTLKTKKAQEKTEKMGSKMIHKTGTQRKAKKEVGRNPSSD